MHSLPVPHALFVLRQHLALIFLSILSILLLQAQKANGQGKMPPYPLDVAAAEDGTIYVVDRYLPGVWKWKDGALSVFFQGSPKYRTPLNAARAIAIGSEGEVLVADTSTRDIYKVTQDKAEPITGGKIGMPMDIAVAKDGSLYIADLELRRLFKIEAGSQEPKELAAVNPRGVGIGADGKVWVVSQQKAQLQIVDDSGKVEAVVADRKFQFPHQIAFDEDGNAYVTDGYAKAVWKVTAGAEPVKIISGEPLAGPVGITAYKDGLLVADPKARKVFQLSLDGELTELFEIKQ
ncbi:MAG: NHL repeat-containing protein [Planctomycetota bacterium]|nr:NHL repeat-containing protein [Planctomycetota bacterium]